MKKHFIVNFEGKKEGVNCLGCDLIKGVIKNPSKSGYVSKYFDVHQDVEIPIPGFMIMASKRHLKSIDDFTKEEQQDFIKTLVLVRKALRKALNLKVVYLFQNEDTDAHFHLWIFPRHKWMDKFGKKIQSVHTIMEYARENLKTKDNLGEVKKARIN